MVSVQDLCVGNWVYDGERTQFPMQVVGIGSDYVYLDFEGNESDLWESKPEDLMGIPLSEELLDKIGVIHYTSFLMFLLQETPSQRLYVEFLYKDNEDRSVRVLCHDKNKNLTASRATSYSVHYLHELQNLFWNITKQQLKVNL